MSTHAGACPYCRKRCANNSALTRHYNACRQRRLWEEAISQQSVPAGRRPQEPSSLSQGIKDTLDAYTDDEPSKHADQAKPQEPTPGTLHASGDALEEHESDNSSSGQSAEDPQTGIARGPNDERHLPVHDWIRELESLDLEAIEGVDDPLGLCADIFDNMGPTLPPSTQSASDPAHDFDVSSTNTPASHDNESTAASSIVPSAGRLSVSAVVNATTQPFENATGKAAGVGTHTGQNGDQLQSPQPLYGFKSDLDMGFANWVHNERITGKAIDRLLHDPRLDTLVSQLSWHSSEELKEKIGNMQAEGNIGNWVKQEFTIRTSIGDEVLTIRYRPVVDAVRFFLGHQGFEHDLVYAPYRSWTDSDTPRRIYNEMASADWWWRTQSDQMIPEGATIVPLIIASDKTQVTNHAGDLAAHAVYLTVGNLNRRTRHSNTRPGSIQIALLPIPKNASKEDRDNIFHKCLKLLFDECKKITDAEGINIRCADRKTRQCFPIVAGVTTDYEEQVKYTGVKSNRHCVMCKISPDDREDLEAVAPWRTQYDTKAQIQQQRNGTYEGSKDDTINDIDCFTWGHRHVNIHKAMMIDILHQLLKGLLMHVLEWCQEILFDTMPKANGPRMQLATELATQRANSARGQRVQRKGRRATQQQLKPSKERVIEIIDRRFASITKYPKLRVFKHFSAIQQWTGKEQKSMVRQLLAVFSPLLLEAKQPEAVRFLRAVVDFVLIASYPSHDSDTLGYLKGALYRMNQHKEVFCKYRPSPRSSGEASTGGESSQKEGHFNFPKWHALTHYVHMIEEYGSALNFNTNHSKHQHVTWIKHGFALTNKKPGWEDQIMEFDRRLINIKSAFDIPYPPCAQHAEEEPAIKPLAAVNLASFFGWGQQTIGRARRRKQDTTMTVEDVIQHLDDEDGKIFQHALAVFARESGIYHVSSPSGADPDRLEDDSSWVRTFDVQFHSGIRCWKNSGDPDNVEAMEPDIVRTCPNWQGIKGNARRDWIWVQEYQQCISTETESSTTAFHGRLPAQVQYVVTVQNPANGLQCSGVLVDIARPKTQGGTADNVHGMTVIKRVPPILLRKPRKLNGRQIYPLTSVFHSIHVVPVDENSRASDADYYINNTADWETYNTLYNDDWEEDAICAAAQATRERRRGR